MNDKVWKLAALTDAQIREVKEAEPTLGSINLLAFQPIDLKLARLDESQIERLRGLEKKLGVTIVAYQKG